MDMGVTAALFIGIMVLSILPAFTGDDSILEALKIRGLPPRLR